MRSISAVGAYLQVGSNAFVANLGTLAGLYRTAAVRAEVTASTPTPTRCGPIGGNGWPQSAYIIERMVDDAADELAIDPDRTASPQHGTGRGDAVQIGADLHRMMPGEFAKTLDMALRLGDSAGFEQRRAAAQARGKLRGFGISNTVERAAAGGLRGGRNPSRPGSGTVIQWCRVRSPRVRALKPFTSNCSATVSASTPGGCITSRATPTKSPTAKAPAARARRHSAGRRCISQPKKIVTKAKDDRRPARLAPRRARRISPTWPLYRTAFEPGFNGRRGRGRIVQPAELARRHGAGLIAGATFTSKQQNFPERQPYLRA